MLALFSASFLLPGCEKSELLLSPETTGENARALPNSPISSVVVQIDHISVRGTDPDYKVTLLSTGKVIFVGRKNVSEIGLRYLQVDDQTVAFIRNMFLAAHFFHLPSADLNSDVPFYVETTFVYGTNVKTIRDHNNGTPQIPLQLRIKTETLLGIDGLIGGFAQDATSKISD